MKIDVSELLSRVGTGADIEKSVKLSFPEDGLSLTEPTKIKLHLVSTGTAVLLEGSAQITAPLTCARCLEKFDQPIVVELKEEFSTIPPTQPSKKGREIELKEDDFASPIGKDNLIDLTEVIRQNLLLALPFHPICSEDCQGNERKG